MSKRLVLAISMVCLLLLLSGAECVSTVPPTDGDYVAFIEGQDSIYQLLDEVIQSNKTYTLTFDALDRTKVGSPCVYVRYYYEDPPGTKKRISDRQEDLPYQQWETVTLSFYMHYTQPYVGKRLGIQFQNRGERGCWINVDNVHLEVDPCTPVYVENPSFEEPDLGKVKDWSLIPGWSCDDPCGTGVEKPLIIPIVDVNVVNPSFELDLLGEPNTTKRGFGEVQGWQAGLAQGCGVESSEGWTNADGNMVSFGLWSDADDGGTDQGDWWYQFFPDFIISEAMAYRMRFSYGPSSAYTPIKASYIYDSDGAGAVAETGVSTTVVHGDRKIMWEYMLDFIAAPNSPYLGKKLGVKFELQERTGWQSAYNGWASVDNVRIQCTPHILAWNPYPAVGTMWIPRDVKLTWNRGANAVTHDVYLGTDLQAVSTASRSNDPCGVLKAVAQSQKYYQTSDLEPLTKHYWRIDEPNEENQVKYPGEVWSFTTRGDGLPDANLLGYWKLDDPCTDAFDSSGYVLDGWLVGDPNHVGESVDGNSLYFDGSGDYVEVPPLYLNSNTMTISAFVKREGDQKNFAGIFFCGAGDTMAGLNLGMDNELRYHWGGDPNAYTFDSGLVLPDGQWAMAALVIEPTKATFYMGNAKNVVSATRTRDHVAEEFNGFSNIGRDPRPGASGVGREFKGLIDEVRVYRRALNGTEIAALAALYNPGCDIDKNGTIDANDVGILADNWLMAVAPPGILDVDIVPDGRVNYGDFAAMAAEWSD